MGIFAETGRQRKSEKQSSCSNCQGFNDLMSNLTGVTAVNCSNFPPLVLSGTRNLFLADLF